MDSVWRACWRIGIAVRSPDVLACSGFRILYWLRVRLSEHIGKLPLGYLNNTSTGAIKKTMAQNIEKIEGFIAHTIPDLVNVVATVAVILFLNLIFGFCGI